MPQIYHVGNYLGDATPGHKIYNEYGTAMTDRSRLEFTGEGVEVTDDAVNGKTVVSISGGGGGGIPLANPTNISITNQDEAAAICWTDPPNIIIDMETIATWAGTLVVRKAGAAPQSKTDGVIVVDSRVRDQYASTGFVDTGLTNGVTYYYGIFPYTTQNVYNYNSVTQFTPAAVYPTAVSDLAASGGNAQATVTWTTPADASSVNIVVSATGETDRTFTAATSPLTVTGLTNNTTYTVKAVSVNTKGRTTESAGVTVTPKGIIKFAVHYSENNSDPDSCDYPQGYDNYGWTPMYVNLSTGVPVYGSWDREGANGDIVNWLYPKSCMLLQTGTVDYYLDENDETKKADGTASDVANTSYAGNAMMEWAQDGAIIHWKIIPDQDGHGFTFVVANYQADGDMKPWNHYNCDGDVAEHFYTPKYFGSSDGTRLRSISGGTNYVNHTESEELTLAKANNLTAKEIWNTEVYSDWLFIGLLQVLLCKNMNTQAKFGSGRCKSTNSAAIGQGTMNGKGLFFGSNDETSGVKIFGMENPYGNIWRRIAGLINDQGTVKIKLTYGKQDGSTVEGYNTTGSGYISHGTMAGTSGGYTSHMNITNRGITPETISGSDSTYYCDGAWFNNGQVDYALVGGYWNGGLIVGCLCVLLDRTVSNAAASFGAALSCKPLAS